MKAYGIGRDDQAPQGPRRRRWLPAAVALLPLLLGAVLVAGGATAQQLSVDLGEGGTMTGRLFQIIALMTVLSLAPSILVTVTSFTRIVIVLSMLRNAIGVQQAPPNMLIISLSLFLTAFIMAPTFEKSWADGIRPLINEEIDEFTAFDRSVQPFKVFMAKHVRDKDLDLFLGIAKAPVPKDRAEAPLTSLIPAFMISEFKRAFEIAFLLFVPFIVIDMVVASLLMAMGMMMLPPVLISMPFKLIFFVLVDGWYLVVGSLVKSFTG